MRDNPYLNRFFTAFQFLTIIPLPLELQVDEEALGRAGVFFPLIGFLLGLILVLIYYVLVLILPPSLSDFLIMIVPIILSGGLHLDGFCDTLDGLASRKEKTEVLQIMRDSRLGAMGATGAFSLLMLKYLAFYHIDPPHKSSFLILMPTIGRYSIVHLSFFSSYARVGPGKGRPFTDYLTRGDLSLAFIQSLLLSLVFLGYGGMGLLLLAMSLTSLWGVYVKRWLGGITGDILGATNEFNEGVILLVGAAFCSG